MTRFFIICSIFLCLIRPAHAGSFELTVGGPGIDYAYDCVECSDEGFLVAGKTNSYGAGTYDVYLVRVSAEGDTLWTRTWGWPGEDIACSIAKAWDDGYIIAGHTSLPPSHRIQTLLIRIDSDGDTLWTRRYGGSIDTWARCIAQSADSGYIVTGYRGNSQTDIFLMKTDGQGDTLWTRTYVRPENEQAYALVESADSGFVIVGRKSTTGVVDHDLYIIKTDAHGDTSWTMSYGGTDWDQGNAIDRCDNGGYIIAGETASFGNGVKDIYLVRIDNSGDTLWTRTYGTSGDDYGTAVVQSWDGNIMVTGSTFQSESFQVILLKTDNNGNTLWNRTFGEPIAADQANTLIECTDGGYFLAGETHVMNDFYLIKSDETGSATGIFEESHLKQVNPFTLRSYPNPFNSATTIDFGIAETYNREICPVELHIYNVLGQKVCTLLDDDIQPGNYTVHWDTGGIPAGIYFCHLKVGPVMRSVKLLVLP